MAMLRKSRYSAIDEKLFYLLGLLSTMQILSICGITLFNLILYITFIYLLLSSRSIGIDDKMVAIYIVFIAMSVGVNVLFSFISKGYENRAIKTFINVAIMLIVYLVSSKNISRCKKFLVGFNISCKIQLYFCLLQIVCINLLNIDINTVIFNRVLKMTMYQTQTKNGRVVCTGLHWHSANLIPILIYLYLFSNSWMTKGACLLIAFVAQNTTAILTLGFCVAMEICFSLIKYFKNRSKGISHKKVFVFIVCIAIGVVVYKRIAPYILDKINGLIYRFTALSGDLKGGEGDLGVSSLTHLNYYKNVVKILLESSPVQIIFGYGLDCSGYIYSVLFNQYENMIWIIESDIVNTIINVGIVGFVIYYWFVIRIMILAIVRRTYRYVLLVLAIIIGGITYNIQFAWVLFFELIVYRIMKNDEDTENNKIKGEER